jgi:hypothetical protein
VRDEVGDELGKRRRRLGAVLRVTRDEMSSASQSRREIISLLQATRDAREDEIGK